MRVLQAGRRGAGPRPCLAWKGPRAPLSRGSAAFGADSPAAVHLSGPGGEASSRGAHAVTPSVLELLTPTAKSRRWAPSVGLVSDAPGCLAGQRAPLVAARPLRVLWLSGGIATRGFRRFAREQRAGPVCRARLWVPPVWPRPQRSDSLGFPRPLGMPWDFANCLCLGGCRTSKNSASCFPFLTGCPEGVQKPRCFHSSSFLLDLQTPNVFLGTLYRGVRGVSYGLSSKGLSPPESRCLSPAA